MGVAQKFALGRHIGFDGLCFAKKKYSKNITLDSFSFTLKLEFFKITVCSIR